jgi:hypothetical protein
VLKPHFFSVDPPHFQCIPAAPSRSSQASRALVRYYRAFKSRAGDYINEHYGPVHDVRSPVSGAISSGSAVPKGTPRYSRGASFDFSAGHLDFFFFLYFSSILMVYRLLHVFYIHYLPNGHAVNHKPRRRSAKCESYMGIARYGKQNTDSLFNSCSVQSKIF